jgi:hypothetical protein
MLFNGLAMGLFRDFLPLPFCAMLTGLGYEWNEDEA